MQPDYELHLPEGRGYATRLLTAHCPSSYAGYQFQKKLEELRSGVMNCFLEKSKISLAGTKNRRNTKKVQILMFDVLRVLYLVWLTCTLRDPLIFCHFSYSHIRWPGQVTFACTEIC